MSSLRHLRFFALATACLAIGTLSLSAQDSSHRGRKYKAPPPTSKVDVMVVRDDDSKPIENAAVVFQLEGEKGNMELKTNEDGKSTIDVLPLGSTMQLQVIAKGYQTYGEQYKIDKAEMTFAIRLKRPAEQYSIYKNHNQDSQNNGKNGGSSSPKDPPPASAQKDKPGGSGSQPSPQNQPQ
jgi:Carboxypeptidase regulatory-like domain